MDAAMFDVFVLVNSPLWAVFFILYAVEFDACIGKFFVAMMFGLLDSVIFDECARKLSGDGVCYLTAATFDVFVLVYSVVWWCLFLDAF